MTAAEPAPLLVPGPLRRPVAVLVAVAAVVFVVLALRYAGTSTAGAVDTRVDAVVDPLGAAHQWLIRHTAALGSPPSVVVLAFALSRDCACCWAGAGLPCWPSSGRASPALCTTLLKPALGRTFEAGTPSRAGTPAARRRWAWSSRCC